MLVFETPYVYLLDEYACENQAPQSLEDKAWIVQFTRVYFKTKVDFP